MKTLKSVATTLMVSLFFYSCNTDTTESPALEANPMEDFHLVSSIDSDGHLIELYAGNQVLTVGYNEIYLRIKDVATEHYLELPQISWMPVMHMLQMDHSSPKSQLLITENPTVAKGFIIFQMPGNTEEFWDLTLNYTVGGQTHSTTKVIDVLPNADGKQKVSAFMGSDGKRYVLAMVEPQTPQVAVSDFVAVLYTMENMMSFPVVENYKIALDPRMPGMGNHSSPNNVDLSYDPSTKTYRGKLALTMTGYWKLNLKLLNETGAVLKGEDVTEENLESSLYFEIEF